MKENKVEGKVVNEYICHCADPALESPPTGYCGNCHRELWRVPVAGEGNAPREDEVMIREDGSACFTAPGKFPLHDDTNENAL